MAQTCCSCRAGALQSSAAAALVRPDCGDRRGERASALAFAKAGGVRASQKLQSNEEQFSRSAFFRGVPEVKVGAPRRSRSTMAAGPSSGGVVSILSEEKGMEHMGMAAVKEADVAAIGAIETRISSGKSLTAPTPRDFVSRYADDEPRKGSDILVEALEREGVRTTFAYPGGASMEIHQALTRSNVIRNVLCRHEQGEIFAAEGYAKSSGRVGVCIATSGPGATNLVTGFADALLDRARCTAVTGQVPRRFIGTDALQETPIVEVTRSITKHNYLVMTVEDIPRVIREAFFLAASGRPGPVLVDIPKDIQQQMAIPDWNQPMKLQSYLSRLPPPPQISLMQQIIRLLATAKKPVIYSGGGCLHASKELREFVELTGIPVTSTLMGLGTFPASDKRYLSMLGMHGTVYANYAVDNADMLLAFGVRFDDRVTGKLESFASRASIVHIDIDPAEIGKNKQPHISICADVQLALAGLNKLIKEGPAERPDFSAWRAELDGVKLKWPMKFPKFDNSVIVPQLAIQTLCELTGGNAIISTGVGQHQMWAAQWYEYEQPRRWLTSGGLGAMGFGLPSALGAAATHPDIPVVDIDGDGSFIMNIQELATIHVEKLPVKIMILNNQHLGMVVQWEDRFYKANRAHTYLGDPEAEADIYPDFCKIAEGCKVPSARVTRREHLRDAITKMLETPGPYLLDVIVPHQEHVLPMIPGGASFKEIITEGDGRQIY
ncbi:LOW QUALITY PROTEIN: acetolactate synthase 2, chloroplastic-like [Physcomitrium patens]|uniref:LOW QUALITY PROTEIN: acetolactate synthase 2, chloroplastic-like n=1 Tax=Physcomitrium patens TaxID=3218 RepID=UPI000D150CFE|nr:LOW QUALITY PROTEIN: acetolactate synthase 2, chloroplastic-like [Physcomitrium patens]|eukprot:XP_024356863.1 LOW QUALITY PROTEIN: acetolactate synthase 2, chloroplastic-like [Physcomitrella patens]